MSVWLLEKSNQNNWCKVVDASCVNSLVFKCLAKFMIRNKGIVIFVFLPFFSHDTIFLPFLRNESGQLRKENEELRLRLQRALIRLEDLDNQSDQHGRVHEKMKERLKKMDDYAQEQGQQVIIVYWIWQYFRNLQTNSDVYSWVTSHGM